ncbi:50S ribosomal protein L21 [Candidatus Peribacteria bacterium]|nr:MAG: 50S ribosomal protein L21 [Candidatus Peribacteria bacterium]
MFAVVSIAGFQEMVQEGDTLEIPLQDSEKDKTIEFKDVLMIMKDGGDVVLGKPFVDGASVSVKVIEHGRDKKIRVLKFKKRKRYLRVRGHRQDYTAVEVVSIKA